MVEQFNFLGMCWDIDQALEIVSDGRETDTIPVKAWEQFLGGQKTNPDGSMSLTMGISVNEEHLNKIDLDKPIIVAKVTFPSGQKSPFVIDGWHRIARALQEGKENLNCLVLTEKESLQIRC